MIKFIHDDFLLDTTEARRLYHEFAEIMPIIDYHCHLSPEEVATDRRWDNLTQVWLYGDHYKWRAMRSNGIDEEYITGKASDREKFDKWAETMPYLLRNPLYHWTHLELARYFDVTEVLSPDTADMIWDRGMQKLAEPGMSARGLITQSNVKAICTTDDPLDSLEHHIAVAADTSFAPLLLPTWRPDKGMMIEDASGFNSWTDRLSEITDINITTFPAFLEALKKRHDFFHSTGCRLSDHGLTSICSDEYTNTEIEDIFVKTRSGTPVTTTEANKFKSAMMTEFALMDYDKGWTQQIHYGVMRGNNSRMTAQIGPDTGFDSIGDFQVGPQLARLLDRLDSAGKLPKTILYNINPADNAILATMLGNFQDGTIPGKLQLGSGWWFLDQKDGMESQMEALSQMGLLSRFVGMLTDSRSFLSYTRHEYFRRILCNLLGSDMARGHVPRDMKLVGNMIRDICYNNAAAYFGFNL